MNTSAENGWKGRQSTMHAPPVVSSQAWEAATVRERKSSARDALAAERRRIPWMAVEAAYAFEGPAARPACSTCSTGGVS